MKKKENLSLALSHSFSLKKETLYKPRNPQLGGKNTFESRGEGGGEIF